MTTLTRILIILLEELSSSVASIEMLPIICIFGIPVPFLLIEKAVCSKHILQLLVQNSNFFNFNIVANLHIKLLKQNSKTNHPTQN
jgi:hypothetical protein